MDALEQDNSVLPEVATPEANTPVETQEQEVQNQAQAKQDSKNFRAMRQRQEELERTIREKDEMLNKVLSRMAQEPQPVQEPEVPDDDYIPKGQVKKLAKRELEPVEKRLQELEAKYEQRVAYDRMHGLKTKYSDFDDVVNAETLALLEEKEPELAQAIADTKDPYKMSVQAYKYIKAMKLSEEVPTARHAKEVDKKMENNNKSVQSPAAYDKRPMAQAFKITNEEKSRLFEEMMSAASQVGFSY